MPGTWLFALMRRTFRYLSGAGVAVGCLALSAATAFAISIELKDVAQDRIERQRAFTEGRLPLAKTPDTARLADRLTAAGVKSGSPILLRIFKETSELELWIEKGDRFVLLATYPICHWSGTLGPKLKEGDKQTPEGFYAVSQRQLRRLGRWPRAINLGFPNAYDRALDRDGSYILMHGGCSSVGCFAMTNPVMSEIHGLATAAIKSGQRYVPVHVFPFRLTDAALAARSASPWHAFWSTLQAGYTSFERTGRPPRVSVCKDQYVVEDARPKSAPADTEDKRGRGKSRSSMMIGALHVGCPEPQDVPAPVTTAGKTHAEALMRNGAHTAQHR
jgi:murein L,D-transpeptidase YafK